MSDFIAEYVRTRMESDARHREALCRAAYALHDGDDTALTLIVHADGSSSVASFWPQQEPYPPSANPTPEEGGEQ